MNMFRIGVGQPGDINAGIGQGLNDIVSTNFAPYAQALVAVVLAAAAVMALVIFAAWGAKRVARFFGSGDDGVQSASGGTSGGYSGAYMDASSAFGDRGEYESHEEFGHRMEHLGEAYNRLDADERAEFDRDHRA